MTLSVPRTSVRSMNQTSRNTRSWTDDQLCVTVAEQVSWRRVALALGLASSAGWRLKRYAERLGLDASHFLEEQGWSEPDLRAAVAVSSSWPDAMRRLGVDDTYELRLRVKGQAVRIGLDVSRLAAHQAPELPALETLAASPDLTHLRRAAELIAVAWFSMRNIPVATPTDPCAYDLLVILGCGVRRVQVKSSASRGGRVPGRSRWVDVHTSSTSRPRRFRTTQTSLTISSSSTVTALCTFFRSAWWRA